MEVNKIVITAPVAHFGVPLYSSNRATHESPPPSTVIGILRNIYGVVDLDDFKMGYTFSYDVRFKDLVKKYKIKVADIGKNKEKVTDACTKEYLNNSKLTIYTDIDLPINMYQNLTLGQADSLAYMQRPIQKVELYNEKGFGYNQYSPPTIGNGRMIPMLTVYTKYDYKTCSTDSKVVKALRFNEKFEYDKNYDKTEGQNILMWHVKGENINEI